MPTAGRYVYRNLSRHYRHFERMAARAGASERKAREWAFRQVQKGRRAP